MPHYMDGTPAKVGDFVKGRGYNIPHDIIGQVIEVKVADTCNLTIQEILEYSFRATPAREYGEAAAFKRIGA